MSVRRALAALLLCMGGVTLAAEPAAFDLGRQLRATDSVRARALIGQAASEGHAPAMFILSSMLFEGEGGAADPALARMWLERAAALEHPEAMQQLAHFLQDGTGGYAPDSQRAAQLMRHVGHAMKHRMPDHRHGERD